MTVSTQGFEVRELRGGHSGVSFDYRIMARRKGYENMRLEDVTEDFRRPLFDPQAAPVPIQRPGGALDATATGNVTSMAALEQAGQEAGALR